MTPTTASMTHIPSRRPARGRLSRAGQLLAVTAIAPVLLVACSDSGSSPSTSSTGSGGGSTTAGKQDCTPKAGSDLVVLKDDKQSQASDNIVPLVTKKVANPPLTTALNKVSAALTQDKLVGLNKAVSGERKTPADAASAFVKDNDLASGLSGGSGSILIGTQDFGEAKALGEVYKQVLSAAGYSASVKTIGTRDLLEPAMERGEVQVVPEYAASLTEFLAKRQKSDVHASADIDKTMATLKPLVDKAGLVALDPADATDQNAFAVTKATADAYGLTSMSDVAAKCSQPVTFGAGANCPANQFCTPAIESTYAPIKLSLQALDYDGPLTRNALKQGRILIGEVFSSDADLVQAGS